MATTAHGLDGLLALAGADLGVTGWLPVTQDRVDRFADATDDHQWIHVDVQRAKDGPFGGTIAHGYLTVALLIPLWTELLRIDGVDTAVNYGLNRLRFPAPVPVGSRIRLRATVTAATEVRGPGVELVTAMTVDCDQADRPVAVAEAVYRYYTAAVSRTGA